MLMVAIVGVRTFGLARPALRYAERLVSHDAALPAAGRAPCRRLRRAGAAGARAARPAPRRPAHLRGRRRRLPRRRPAAGACQPGWTAVGVGLLATLVAALPTPVAGLVTAAVVLGGALGGWPWPVAASRPPSRSSSPRARPSPTGRGADPRGAPATWCSGGPPSARSTGLDATANRLGPRRSPPAPGRRPRAVPFSLLAGGAGFLAMAAAGPRRRDLRARCAPCW